MIDQSQVPEWLVRGRLPLALLIVTRIGLTIYVLIVAGLLAFVVWGLFFCSTEVVDGLDPKAPLSDRLLSLLFPIGCLALGIFGLKRSFNPKGKDSQQELGQVSSETAVSDELSS